jgi:hypothetical protein
MGVLFPVTSLSANKLRAAKLFIRAREGFIYQSVSAVIPRQIGARFGDGSVEGLNYFGCSEGERRRERERENRATQHVN